MKAVCFYGSGDVRCEDIPEPDCGAPEVLIHVLYAGICGSDLHRWRKGMFTDHIPETMGHEFVGVIEKTGPEVKGYHAGELVTANPMLPCGKCPSCQQGDIQTCSRLSYIGEAAPGCFAEKLVLPADVLIPVPETKDLAPLALAEPLAVALNICERAKFRPDDSVYIIGCGTIGLLTILAAEAIYHVKDITVAERSPARLQQAVSFGAAADDGNDGKDGKDRQYDKVIEAAGNTVTLNLALKKTRPRGDLLVVSVFEEMASLDMNEFIGAQLNLLGCNGYESRHIAQAARILASGEIDVRPLISKILPFAKCREAFELLTAKNTSAVKILFHEAESC